MQAAGLDPENDCRGFAREETKKQQREPTLYTKRGVFNGWFVAYAHD